MRLGPLLATENVTDSRNRPTGTSGNSTVVQTTWGTALGKKSLKVVTEVSNVS